MKLNYKCFHYSEIKLVLDAAEDLKEKFSCKLNKKKLCSPAASLKPIVSYRAELYILNIYLFPGVLFSLLLLVFSLFIVPLCVVFVSAGSCTVRWENRTMYCVVSVFAVAIA